MAKRKSGSEPVYTAKEGRFRLAVWEVQREDGGSFYTCTINRSWRADDGEWRRSSSFAEGDVEDIEMLISKFKLFISPDDKSAKIAALRAELESLEG